MIGERLHRDNLPPGNVPLGESPAQTAAVHQRHIHGSADQFRTAGGTEIAYKVQQGRPVVGERLRRASDFLVHKIIHALAVRSHD